MNENFEQSIPLPAIIAGFIILLILSNILRSSLRKRALVKQGQISAETGRIPTIEERVAGNPGWAKGEILSKGRTFMIVMAISALAVNLTLGIGFIKALFNPAVQTAPLVVLGVFAVLGFAFGIIAVRIMMRYLRFGQSRCFIADKAGVLGKKMTGVIRTLNEVQAAGDYNIELQCIESYSTGSGKNRRTEIKSHFQAKQQVPHQGKSSKAGIPFSFELPKYAPETGHQLSRGSIDWHLRIHAPLKGIDYAASFLVPVFKMDYSD